MHAANLFRFFFTQPGARLSARTVPHGPFRGEGTLDTALQLGGGVGWFPSCPGGGGVMGFKLGWLPGLSIKTVKLKFCTNILESVLCSSPPKVLCPCSSSRVGTPSRFPPATASSLPSVSS